jgi:hypothetical protein
MTLISGIPYYNTGVNLTVFWLVVFETRLS